MLTSQPFISAASIMFGIEHGASSFHSIWAFISVTRTGFCSNDLVRPHWIDQSFPKLYMCSLLSPLILFHLLIITHVFFFNMYEGRKEETGGREDKGEGRGEGGEGSLAELLRMVPIFLS